MAMRVKGGMMMPVGKEPSNAAAKAIARQLSERLRKANNEVAMIIPEVNKLQRALLDGGLRTIDADLIVTELRAAVEALESAGVKARQFT